jgi:hypothetical protein
MNRQWMMIGGAVLLAVLVGVVAYNAGIDRGIEQSGKIVAPPAGAVPYPYAYPVYWHRPWFGGFFFFPLFVFALVLLFRGRHRRYACRYDHDPDRGR